MQSCLLQTSLEHKLQRKLENPGKIVLERRYAAKPRHPATAIQRLNLIARIQVWTSEEDGIGGVKRIDPELQLLGLGDVEFLLEREVEVRYARLTEVTNPVGQIPLAPRRDWRPTVLRLAITVVNPLRFGLAAVWHEAVGGSVPSPAGETFGEAGFRAKDAIQSPMIYDAPQPGPRIPKEVFCPLAPREVPIPLQDENIRAVVGHQFVQRVGILPRPAVEVVGLFLVARIGVGQRVLKPALASGTLRCMGSTTYWL